MPKTLSPTDPHLQTAVARLKRVHLAWGGLLIVLGLLTVFMAGPGHPLAGLPFLLVGAACLYLREPALLAAVAVTIGLSLVATISGSAGLLGPDPLVALLEMGTAERWTMVLVKFLVVLTAANQFFFYRLLYGTERAVSNDPNLPIIPPMVPNRTDWLARWARLLGLFGTAGVLLSLVLMIFDPSAWLARGSAELGGSLGAVALGAGLGAAFAPTDQREAALWGVSLGLVSFIAAALILLRLPA